MTPQIIPKPGERWIPIDNIEPHFFVVVRQCDGFRIDHSYSFGGGAYGRSLDNFRENYRRDDSTRWPRTAKGEPPRPLRTKFSVGELLANLGNTPDEVAATLRRSGVKGDHGCGSCPVAVYLSRLHPAVNVGAVTAGTYGHPHYLPQPVAVFISLFDSQDRHFRDLEAV